MGHTHPVLGNGVDWRMLSNTDANLNKNATNMRKKGLCQWPKPVQYEMRSVERAVCVILQYKPEGSLNMP